MPAEAPIGGAAWAFLERGRVGHLATADAAGAPHVVPVCYALVGETAYISIDEKPKSGDAARLKRLRNITANPLVALVVDHYEDADWSRLGWVMLRGRAEILATGAEHDTAQDVLRQRYAQYRGMDLAALPVIAIRVERVSAWGDLSSHDPAAPVR
jgi:PPOX class probable F420-dependent enzyme